MRYVLLPAKTKLSTTIQSRINATVILSIIIILQYCILHFGHQCRYSSVYVWGKGPKVNLGDIITIGFIVRFFLKTLLFFFQKLHLSQSCEIISWLYVCVHKEWPGVFRHCLEIVLLKIKQPTIDLLWAMAQCWAIMAKLPGEAIRPNHFKTRKVLLHRIVWEGGSIITCIFQTINRIWHQTT